MAQALPVNLPVRPKPGLKSKSGNKHRMKNFLKTVLALLVIVVIGVVFLISRINTENNKQAIASAVLDATGYELVIGGDLSLDIFPTLGVSLDDVRLRNPAVPQELASTSRAVLRVPLASLARGEINVQEISADDFHVNYFVGPDGKSIWEIDRDADTAEASEPSGDGAPAFSIDRIMFAILDPFSISGFKLFCKSIASCIR